MESCPYCGAKTGLYSKETASFDQFYTFDGEMDGYSDLRIKSYRKTTPLYCLHCDKKVTTLEKLEERKCTK